jgi:hypothetical protein
MTTVHCNRLKCLFLYIVKLQFLKNFAVIKGEREGRYDDVVANIYIRLYPDGRRLQPSAYLSKIETI